MQTIKVQVGQLATTLETNKGTHRNAYEKAVERYRSKAVELFEENIKEVKKGGPVRQHLALPVPEDHTKDYDRALQMLEWHQGEEIELTMGEFQTYVQDDWGWKQSFSTTNMTYGVAS